jgi:hypothetical protein
MERAPGQSELRSLERRASPLVGTPGAGSGGIHARLQPGRRLAQRRRSTVPGSAARAARHSAESNTFAETASSASRAITSRRPGISRAASSSLR